MKWQEHNAVIFPKDFQGHTGIIFGIEDKTYLPQKYGKRLGKAEVTGYCIRFKKLKDIHKDILRLSGDPLREIAF